MTLSEFFQENNHVAIAFSGGVDSAYLLYAAKKSGADVTAYYGKTLFQPQFEYDDAQKLAAMLGVSLRVVPCDILSAPHVAENPENRCYYCKKALFSAIRSAAERDGYSLLLDGTNASDDLSDRPGLLALTELSIRSPLRECGLSKAEIRIRSRNVGLFTWQKPAYACLATRIPTGTAITPAKLQKTENAEAFLASLGFTDFRVRLRGETALLQVPAEQLTRVLNEREKILSVLKQFYKNVVLDLEIRP